MILYSPFCVRAGVMLLLIYIIYIYYIVRGVRGTFTRNREIAYKIYYTGLTNETISLRISDLYHIVY